MKKVSGFRTALSIILIIAIMAIGVFVVLKATELRNSTFKINIVSKDLNMSLVADASWNDDNWETSTGPAGFKDPIWNMPNLRLSQSNTITPEELKLNLNNKNRNDATQFEIMIEGLPFDKNVNTPRYVTKVTCVVDGQSFPEVEIVDAKPVTFSEIRNTAKEVVLRITYKLNDFSSSFSFKQDLILTITESQIGSGD